ncbi:MAG: PH domain-containing protein, partial [Clostridiales Family XIII bacterium]|nr:PH domain-containing protein [Clostridiales Family XIII bacterium]
MFELNKRYKLHKAYLCFFVYNGIRTVFLPLLIIAIANLRYAKGFLRETGFSLPAALLLLTALIIALIFVFALISYSRYKWELTGSEIRIYKGVIFLKKIRIPFTRINTVETSAKLIERLFGLVSVRFDTAGGSNNKADAVLPMLRLDEAEALKAEIFNLRDGGTVAHEGIINDDAGAPTDPAAAVAAYNPATPGAAYDTVQSIGIAAGDVRGVLGGRDSDSVPIEYEYRLTGKEIFLAGIANSHALISV